MRIPQYLSPTSLSLWLKDKTEFYLVYMSDNRPPKFLQTGPMSVGSSFDAYAKSFLHERLFGKGQDPKFDLLSIFEAQVETQNRDFAWEAGKWAFECYQKSGALADLMLELQSAIGPPRFELEVRGVVAGRREAVTAEIGEVVLLGKPDVFFTNKTGARVILDWKVNGYLSKYTVSPMPGYVRLREHGKNVGQHKKAQLLTHNGMMINVGTFLEYEDEDWARQLAIYAWLCGEDIGGDFIAAIDQLVCKDVGLGRPSIRVAEHRLRIHDKFQWQVFGIALDCWQTIHSDHIFRDMSPEDSKLRCQTLDGVSDAIKGTGSPEDKWFADATRRLV